MKKFYILLFSIATAIAISTNDVNGNVVYAANIGARDNVAAVVPPGDITPETYARLIDELMHVGDRYKSVDHKVNLDGEIRYHHALNSGPEPLGRDLSGIRARLGFDTAFKKDWHVYAMLEGQVNLENHQDEFKLSRLYAAGELGESMIRAGSFGYLMAEGNVYDSGFKGVRVDVDEPVKYSFGYGQTNYTKETYVATARYTDFDYNLESGVYHYRLDDNVRTRNTIWNLGGNYNFSNFGVGAMVLGSSQEDSNGDNLGYVCKLTYGDLKTYRPDTYNAFAKYYNQPQGTYIAQGMNSSSSWLMQGFKGYGFGMNYTIRKDFVLGMEYYDLTDKITGERSQTWWNQLNYYF